MTRRRWVPLALGAVVAALAAATAAFVAAGWGLCDARWQVPGSNGAEACARMIAANAIGVPSEFLSMAALGLFIGAIGAVVARKRPQNAVGWWLLATGVLLVVNPISTLYANHALNEDPGSLPLGMVAALISQAAGGPIIFIGFIFVFLLFPSGHLLTARWRWVAAAAIAGFGFTTLGGTLETDLRVAPLDDNPIAWGWLQEVRDLPEMIAGILMLVAVTGSLVSMVVRYRRSRGEERQQMRWITWSAGLFALSLIVAPIFWATPSLEPLWGFLFVLSVGSIPVTAAIAILKYRLYEIDVIVNRTLVYAVLTSILGSAYLATVVILQSVLEPLTQESDIAVAGSTLAVAALFRPLRGRVQQFIDQRFYRRKYNAALTVEAFSKRLRDEVDLEVLTDDLVTMVGETLQPRHATLWLRAGASGEGGSGA